MVVDYSHEAITEAAIFSRLPELPNYGIVSTETTDSHWYLDIKPTDPRTLPFFIREQDSLATAAGLIAGDFVDIVISCPKLMKGSVKTSYPKSLLVGNQKPPIQFPSSTLLFIDLVRTFGSKWSKTIADGAPYDHIEHTKPGYIHVRDYVIYRILLRAARENNVKIALLLDPVMGFAPYVEQQGPPSYFNKLCYCSNMACMRLGYPKKQCAGCRVSLPSSRDVRLKFVIN